MVKNRLKPRMFDAVQQAAGFAPMFDRGFVTLKYANDSAPTLERLLAVFAKRHGLCPIDLEPHRWTSALDRVPLKAAFRSSAPQNSDGSAHLARRWTNRPCSWVWTRSPPAAVIKKGGAGAATWVPAIYRNRDFVLTGGLMGYHASFDGYRVMSYAGRIFEGVKQPTCRSMRPRKSSA